MKTILLTAIWLVILCLVISGCSKLNDPLPAGNNGVVKAAHSQSWLDTSSARFHGVFLKSTDWNLADCQPCHGGNLQGGTSNQSCYSCHKPFPHPDLWDTTFVGFRTSDHFHGTWLRVNDWKLTQCQACHGHAYDGGRVDFSCTQSGCHVDKNGAAKAPEACNTCHGDFRGVASDTASWAPPRGIYGDTLEAVAGVGAHQAHLVDGDLSTVIRCAECHTVPSSYTDAGHIDASGQAHVLFNGGLAGTTTGNGTFTTHPSFDPGTLKCSNVYCHGSWKADSASAPIDNQFVYSASAITGNNFSPMWTSGESQAQCGTTCHNLPPTGHGDMGGSVDDPSPCYGCHYGSDTMDKAKHINGKITYGGEDRGF